MSYKYREEKVGRRYYSWYECTILGCDNVAEHQHAATGHMVCKDHFDQLAYSHKTAFVKIDGGKKPRKRKKCLIQENQ